MLRPVGPQPAAVYWRRRLVLLASVAALLVLAVLTVNALRSGGGAPAAANETTSPASSSPASSGAPSSSAAPSTSPAAKSPSASTASSGAASATTTTVAPPATCVVKSLKVSAVVGKSTYAVGDKPLLELQVVNPGAKPCVQDLADKQVELRVYNGESRVWGSHDCQVEPGTNVRTLASNVPVRVQVSWSGLTSQPGANGCQPSDRQRVGAGTYTLYASLAGRSGAAAQFTIN